MAYTQTNNTKPVYGEQSQSVLGLQQELNAKGAGLRLDGKYGPLTQAAFDKYNTQAQAPAMQGTNIPIDAITNQPKPMELASNVPGNRMTQSLYQDAIAANQGLISAQQQGSQQESGITDIMKALGTESQFTNKQLDEQGVTAGQKRLSELQAMAMGETNRLTSDILRNESNAIGTRETSNFLGAQEARMRRESAINLLSIASEAAIVQGQTELAQANVDRMVKAVYEPLKMEKDIALFNLQRLDKNLLEPAQKAKAEATERRLNYEAKQLEKQQAFAQGLLANGATPQLMKQVLEVDSLEEAMIIPGIQKYMQSPLERAQLKKIEADIDNMNSVASPGLSLKERASLLKDPTTKKAVAGINLVTALSSYSDKVKEFKTTRKDLLDANGKPIVRGGGFFGSDLSKQEKAVSEQLIDSMIAPALSLAQQQGVIQAGEADAYKKKLKIARLRGAKYVPAVVSQIIDATNNSINTDFDFIDSSIPGATDSYQIFADYKQSLLPDDMLFSGDSTNYGETIYQITQ